MIFGILLSSSKRMGRCFSEVIALEDDDSLLFLRLAAVKSDTDCPPADKVHVWPDRGPPCCRCDRYSAKSSSTWSSMAASSRSVWQRRASACTSLCSCYRNHTLVMLTRCHHFNDHVPPANIFSSGLIVKWVASYWPSAFLDAQLRLGQARLGQVKSHSCYAQTALLFQ